MRLLLLTVFLTNLDYFPSLVLFFFWQGSSHLDIGSMALYFAMRYYEHSIDVVGKMVLGIVKNCLNSGVLEDLFICERLSLK